MIEFTDIQTTAVVLLALCGTVGLLWNTRKIAKEAKQPQEERLKRLSAVEEHLDNDNKRLRKLEKESRFNLRAQLLMIEHLTAGGVGSPGDKTEELNLLHDEIQAYLINK